jgi:co-chaperonin GroES (HSP10)
MWNVRPVGSKVYVKLLIANETKSGLLIVKKSQDWQEDTLTAEIVTIGKDCSFKELQPGMMIIIPGHAGKWIDPVLTPDETLTYRMIDQDEIIAYMEETI